MLFDSLLAVAPLTVHPHENFSDNATDNISHLNNVQRVCGEFSGKTASKYIDTPKLTIVYTIYAIANSHHM